MPVYVVGHSPRTGPVKIGYASNLEDRLRALRRGETCPLAVHQRFSGTRPPSDLALLHSLDGDRRLEREVHLRLREYRLEGEWFSLGHTPTEVVGLVDKAANLTGSNWRSFIAARCERRSQGEAGLVELPGIEWAASTAATPSNQADARHIGPSEAEIRAGERRIIADLLEARYKSAPNADQREALREILEVLRPDTWQSGRR